MHKVVQNSFENAFYSGKGSMVLLREFIIGDIGRVYEIESRSFKDPYHPVFLLNLYETYPRTFLVALENEMVVGYVISRTINAAGHIIAIAVDPIKRRREIGKTLMVETMKRLRGCGVNNIWLEVRKSNIDAIEFYRKLGFVKGGIVRGYYSDSEDAIILRRLI
ncbi:ribosomal protein S18-alanine N-acetyltransferase [archaeon]|nr:ribosomal protein S18-alanine N-acetyltransferase [archaeon]